MKLSVIIPTFNEAKNINQTIEALYERAATTPYEIIVVDCGSSDGTMDCIKRKEVITIINPRLAGKKCRSLRMGTNIAQGEVLLFLDGDTLVPQQYDKAIEKALQNPEVVGGAFEFALDKKSVSFFLFTLVNRIRYRFRKRFYGDQGVFVRKEIYQKAGGWPERSLLETAYLCKNLQKWGKLQLISQPMVTSSRRFTEGGVWRVFLHDVRIWAMDLFGMDVEQYGKAYWAKNEEYGRKKEAVLLDEIKD